MRGRTCHERQRPLHDNGEEQQERDERRVEVVEQERSTWTGLYDADGMPLHRQREPIGYRIRK